MSVFSEPDAGPRLVFSDGPGPRVVSLGEGLIWTLGRSADNRIVIDDSSISRKHALLQRLDGGDIFLVDLGSSNGTFVNGLRVSIPVTLQPGDAVTFGATHCQFVVPDAAAPAPERDRPPESSTRILQVRQLVTVMVVDLRGFTVLTRQINEQTLSAVMSHWFQQAGHVTQRSGGWVDKYIGDAMMALWSHTDGDAGMAHRWLWALAEISQMTARVSERFPLPAPLRIGAGVNTGYAMIGNTGSRDRPDHTALGDTVNATFRLETATRTVDCDALIGEATWRSLEPLGIADAFTSVSVNLKGYDKPTPAYAIDFAAVQAIASRVGPPRRLSNQIE